MATATVSARANSAQKTSTHKPASNLAQQTEESHESGVSALVEILERVSLHEPETPLPPSDVSKLQTVGESLANLARALGDSEEYAEYFAARLALLEKCVEASKSGEFNLSLEQTKLSAGILACKMFQEIRQWAECLTEERLVDLKDAGLFLARGPGAER